MNWAADAAAKRALDCNLSFCIYHDAYDKLKRVAPRYIRVFSDGSHKSGLAGAGWVAYAAWEHNTSNVTELPSSMASFCSTFRGIKDDIVVPRWEPLLTAGTYLGRSTVVNAELSAIEAAFTLLQQVVQGSLRP